MNTNRIKEIQLETSYPESVSVQQALLKVWNETEQEQLRIAAVMRSANCYNELKAFLQEKKKSPRLCAWDSVHHQEIWDKMLELEQKYSEHYA